MSKKACSGCNFQGDSRTDKEGSKIFCLYDQEGYFDTYICNHWRQFSYNMSKDERLRVASNLQKHESDKLGRKIQILIVVILFITAVVAIIGLIKERQYLGMGIIIYDAMGNCLWN